MCKIKKCFIVILIFTLLFLAYLLTDKEKIIINSNDINKIENFDIILSSGQSIKSKIIKILDLSHSVTFSHIGILIKNKEDVYVLHSTPDGTKENSIRYDKIQTFIDISNVNYFKTFRLLKLNEIKRKKIKEIIENYRKESFPFDYDFDNQDKSKLYCSELIYDILFESNILTSKINLEKPIHPDIFTELDELSEEYERGFCSNDLSE